MKSIAVIAEYNPFHKGHAYQLEKIRQDYHPDVLIVILTGLFTSRGLPSIISLEDKTKLALKYGADLVVELPEVYGMQSADQFAKYNLEALKLLETQAICFGSESNDVSYLESLLIPLQHIEKDPSKSMVQNISNYLPKLKPNDILAIQYIRWAKKMNIQTLSIQRNDAFKSATATRQDYFEQKGIQDFQSDFHFDQQWKNYYPYLRLFLQMSSPKDLSRYFLVEEGIENRLKKNAALYDNWQDFLTASISKTYTKARIQRTCLFILMQIKKEDMEKFDGIQTVKILGMNQKGRAYLKQLKHKEHLALRIKDLSFFLKEVHQKARDLYNTMEPVDLNPWKVIYHEKEN